MFSGSAVAPKVTVTSPFATSRNTVMTRGADSFLIRFPFPFRKPRAKIRCRTCLLSFSWLVARSVTQVDEHVIRTTPLECNVDAEAHRARQAMAGTDDAVRERSEVPRQRRSSTAVEAPRPTDR